MIVLLALQVSFYSSGNLHAQENLLANPGFEEGDLSDWLDWSNGGASVTDANPKTGTSSLLLNSDDGGILQPVYELKGDSSYIISGWFKGEGAFLVTMFINKSDSTVHTWLETSQSANSDAWEQIVDTVTLTANDIGIRFIIWTKSEIDNYIDDLKLVPLYSTVGTDIIKIEPFRIYPNPVKDMVQIRFKTSNPVLTIYNSLGKLMEHVTVQGADIAMDVSDYPSGVYFVKVNNYNMQKFVKY